MAGGARSLGGWRAEWAVGVGDGRHHGGWYVSSPDVAPGEPDVRRRRLGAMTRLAVLGRPSRVTTSRVVLTAVTVLLLLVGCGHNREPVTNGAASSPTTASQGSSEASTTVTTRPGPPEEMVDLETAPQTFEELAERRRRSLGAGSSGYVWFRTLIPSSTTPSRGWYRPGGVALGCGNPPGRAALGVRRDAAYNPETGKGSPVRWPDDREFLPGDDLIVALGPVSQPASESSEGPTSWSRWQAQRRASRIPTPLQPQRTHTDRR